MHLTLTPCIVILMFLILMSCLLFMTISLRVFDAVGEFLYRFGRPLGVALAAAVVVIMALTSTDMLSVRLVKCDRPTAVASLIAKTQTLACHAGNRMFGFS